MSKDLKPFNYYNSPDGYDVAQKLLYLYKPAAYTAFGAGTIDVVLYSKPRGYLQTLARYGHFAVPIFGATTAFVLASNISASLRQEDDKWNWFVGGATAGSCYGIWKKTGMGGFTVALACGMIAFGLRYANQRGFDVLPDAKPQQGGIRSVNQDWTLTAHRPGNWVTEAPEEPPEETPEP